MTDNSKLYVRIGSEFAGHQAVDHRADEYARGLAPVNTVEGYFAQLKRLIGGTHHHVSAQHLHRYVSEFDLRYNSRKPSDGERTVLTIKKADGKRLCYRQSIEKEEAEKVPWRDSQGAFKC